LRQKFTDGLSLFPIKRGFLTIQHQRVLVGEGLQEGWQRGKRSILTAEHVAELLSIVPMGELTLRSKHLDSLFS